jgi:hypothetical protein
MMAQYPAIVPEPMGLEPAAEPRRVMSVAEVEVRRRSRLLKYLTFGLGGFLALSLIFLFFLEIGSPSKNTVSLISVCFSLCLCGVGYFLNRTPTARRVMVAAYFVLGGFTATMMISFAFLPGGMGAETLRLFDILLIATVAAGVVIDATAAFIFASVISLYICTVVLLLPPSPTLFAYEYGSAALCQHLGAAAGQQCPTFLTQIFSAKGVGIVGVILQPVLLQFVIAFLTWLAMRSIQAAYRTVDRAVELEAAYKTLTEQKQGLEEDIQHLQQVYTRVVNGDYGARAHLEGRILWPLAQALNTMLDRLGKALLQGQRLAKLEGEVRQLAESLERGRRGMPWAWPAPSGTPLDQLVAVLQQATARGSQKPASLRTPDQPQAPARAPQPLAARAPDQQRAPWEPL